MSKHSKRLDYISLDAQLDAIGRELRDNMAYQLDLEAENRRLTSELEEVKAERDGLNRDQTELAARVDELKAQLADQATAPRVITAEELKAGQLICIHRGHGWGVRAIGTFSTLEGDVVTLKTGGSGVFSESVKFHTIVLLEDAPAEEPEPVKVGDTISSDTRAAELPEGTILLDDDADPWRKDKNGHWRTAVHGPGELVHYTTGPVSYTSEPLTILYLPEEDA